MALEVRKGIPDPKSSKDEFRSRFFARFADAAFDALRPELDRLSEIAWQAYDAGRKAPHTRPAGEGFADPSYDTSLDWLRARAAVIEAQARHEDRTLPSRILIVNASPRSEHTCPGEMSKTWRLVSMAERTFSVMPDTTCEILDLSRLTSAHDLHIHPCKACFSTAPALCHWPCSCYPNHALGQVNDWMAEIYPMWVAAHGIMIVTPVHWYHAPSGLKLMMDRLVCADGGNPDPTLTHGKNAMRAKELENGWPYPRHLANRVFSVIVHGDSAGTESLRRNLTDWLTDMELRPAGSTALLDRYIGYYRPYATSHNDLDGDTALFAEVRNAAAALHDAIGRYRAGELQPAAGCKEPRPK